MTLSRQFALFLIPAWLVTVALLGSLIVSYGLSRAESLLEDTELELLEESANDLQQGFDDIPRAHAVAQASLTYWRDTLSDADVEERFGDAFEIKSDGTWRSRAAPCNHRAWRVRRFPSQARPPRRHGSRR